MGACCSTREETYEVIPLDILELSKHQCEYDLTNSCSVTFYPSPHLKDPEDYGSEMLPHELFTSSSRLHNVLSEIKCNNLISCNDDDLMIIQQESKINPFIECAIRAWTEHFPLSISPQAIWLLILQSVSIYIYNKKATNPLIKKDKSETDIIKLKTNTNTTTTTEDNNNNNAYDYSTTATSILSNKEWILKVKELLNNIECEIILDENVNDLLSCLPYTNSTYLDELSCKLAAMNMLQNSYEYDEATACGFPSITLTGKKDDWLLLREKTTKILTGNNIIRNTHWTDSLLPILDRFIGVYDGEIDCVFWNSMIKRGAMNASNGQVEWYSGWINCFFPLLNKKDNKWCEPYSFDIGYIQSGLKNDDKYGGIEINSFPIGLCHADAVIQQENSCAPPVGDSDSNGAYHEENIKIVSGFLGYTQNRTDFCLKPVVGWFVVSANNDEVCDGGFGARLSGISEDTSGDDNIMNDSGDAERLINSDNNSSTVNIRRSDEDDSVEDTDEEEELGYVKNKNKKKKKGTGKFMAVDVQDDEDETHKELHKISIKL